MSTVSNDFPTHTTVTGGSAQSGAGRVSSLLFSAFATSVIIRFSIPGSVLNVFEHYSSFNQIDSSGNIVEKIHPGSYGIIALTIVMFPRIFVRWMRDHDGIMNSLLIMSASIVTVMAICIFTAQTASIGYLLDSMLVACAAASVALCCTPHQRRLLGNLLLAVVVFSSMMAIVEFFDKTHFLPQEVDTPEGATTIRTAGLFVHPLDLGLYSAVSIPILYSSNWPRLLKPVAITILVFGIFAAGARAAGIAAIGMMILVAIFHKRRRTEISTLILEKALLIGTFLLLISVAWFAAGALGLTERFQREGLVDDSTMARIIIFQVFGFMDWSELIWGVGNQTMYKFAALGLNIASVENSLIVYIFQFGIVGTVFLVGALVNTLIALGRNTQFLLKIALLTFFTVALTNNTLSVKSPSLLFIFIIAIAFRNIAPTSPRQSWGVARVGRPAEG
jgi:hypothetical protein